MKQTCEVATNETAYWNETDVEDARVLSVCVSGTQNHPVVFHLKIVSQKEFRARSREKQYSVKQGGTDTYRSWRALQGQWKNITRC